MSVGIGQAQLSGGVVAVVPRIAANLVVEVDSVTPLSKVKITADQITIEDVLAGSVSVIADIAVAGTNGLDAGAEAASTWYAVWLIYNPSTTTVAALLSTSFSAPTMPAGYTKKRRVGAVRNTSTSNFVPFMQRGEVVLYNETENETRFLSSGLSTTFADASAEAFIPTSSRRGYFGVTVSIDHNAVDVDFSVRLRTKGAPGVTDGTRFNLVTQNTAATIEGFWTKWLYTDSVQTIQYRLATAPSSGNFGVFIDVLGYIDPVL